MKEKRTLRKLIIYTGNFDEPECSAAGKRVFGNALILESIGYEVLMIGKKQNGELNHRKQYTDHIAFESYPQYGQIRFNRYLDYLTKRIGSKKPICIIRYGSPATSLFDYFLIRLAHRQGIKVIADVVDWLAADGRNVAFNCIKTVDTFLEKAVFNSMSDGVIAISSYLEKYYTNKVDNVIIIPPVVSKYRSNVAQNQEIIVMYAGSPFRTGGKVKNIHKIKDRLDLAVTAFSELYKMGRINFQFRIFGITKEQYIQAFPDQKILLDSVNTSIEFFGKRPMNEIQNELSRADFSLLFREITRGTTAGFPTKVVESMSCGTPMITTKTSDLADYIDDGQNGFFVDINNNKHLLVQLQRIMSLSIDEKAKLKENCFKNQQFIYTLFRARMKRLIDSTVN